ncbi:MAG: methionyl-tRNA formyltransferase [Oscillospiraceae bacterium]|nr:methionyl-tRNA formyltransferase [Oscillospiraceae bacterium]
MRILFMGTPDFAVEQLDALRRSGETVVGVFTQPDKPRGRGNKVIPSPVKKYCFENTNLMVYQPNSLKSGDDATKAMAVIKELVPDIIVVAAYGKILPKEILEFPRYGCINVHASLLPAYRGAGPIQWSIINGEKTTGVTIMQMGEGLDTGDMLYSRSIDIGENETADELTARLAKLGGEALIEALDMIKSGSIEPVLQDDSLSSYAPMISKSMAALDFTKPAAEIHRLIRGLSSNPGAYMMKGEDRIKVYKAHLSGRHFDGECGTIADKSDFTVICGDGMGITFDEVQAAGGKRMKTSDFLKGNKL